MSNKSCQTMNEIPLGKQTEYPTKYDPGLLFAVERKIQRQQLQGFKIEGLYGSDRWTAFEVSWVNPKGKPEVAIAVIEFEPDSMYLIESKSLKLYLNSLNQHVIQNRQDLERMIQTDLAYVAKGNVTVSCYSIDDFSQFELNQINGECLDLLDVVCDNYQYDPSLLKLDDKKTTVKTTVYSHLLKSNCLITSQPDWATIVIKYEGFLINNVSILKYIVSFRNHNEFHEHCVERIFNDISKSCNPQKLTVQALYTRRGGLDINPWRSNFEKKISLCRTSRQ